MDFLFFSGHSADRSVNCRVRISGSGVFELKAECPCRAENFRGVTGFIRVSYPRIKQIFQLGLV